MLNFKFTKEFCVIRKFHDLKASEAQLTLPAMCRVEPILESINQSVSQSVSQSVNQSNKQSINQSVC